ncbi:MAG: FtsX-like permease family protein [Dermatophilaceae bacterium]|nr:FtsX-like permease family protein [Dermatophilaceae bacterium]
MIRAAWASLLARKLRLFMSAFAVVLGVAFVAGSFIFTDTLERAFDGITKNTVGDVIVRQATDPNAAAGGGEDEDGGSAQGRTVPGSVVEALMDVPGAERVDGNVAVPGVFVVSDSGKVLGGAGPPSLGVNYTGGPAAHGTTPFPLNMGRWPDKAGEIAMDAPTALNAGYLVGSEVTLTTAFNPAPITATLVGTFEASGLLGATVTVFDTESAQALAYQGEDVYTNLWVTAAPGTSQETLRTAVAAALPAGFEAVTGDGEAAKTASRIQEALGFINNFLLVFAAVALFVGTFLIVNTFSILVAQRSRELALFRAIGASRSQVTQSVLLEALVIGFVGSAVGLALGFVLAWGIAQVFGSVGLDLGDTPLVFQLRTALVAFAVGILVTVFAALLPARRAGSVPPVAAMRDDVVLAESGLGRRTLVGVGLILVGSGAMYAALFRDIENTTNILGAGILGVLLGVALTSPVLGRPLTGALGAAYKRIFGVVGTMARQNADRNPRRTAATASALMIGVTLVTMMATVGASAGASIDKAYAEEFRGDLVVGAIAGQRFSPEIADQVKAVPGVALVAPVREAVVQVEESRSFAVAIDPAAMAQIWDVPVQSGSLADLSADGIALEAGVAKDLDLAVGSTASVSMRGVEQTFRVVAVYTSVPAVESEAMFGLEGFAALGAPDQDSALYVQREAGADSGEVYRGVEKALADQPLVSVKDQAAFAEQQRKPIDQMLTIIYALLGLAVVIAILGIVNTLGLSVIERTREIGLLRAVGLSRSQLRSMIRLESVAISLLGALLGIGLGLLFGIALQRSFADNGIDVLAIPTGQLGVFVALAAVVGVLAAWWPGRRAAQLDILRAIATE